MGHPVYTERNVHSSAHCRSSCSSDVEQSLTSDSWCRTLRSRSTKSSATWFMTSTYANTSFSGSIFRLSTRRARYHSSPCLLSSYTLQTAEARRLDTQRRGKRRGGRQQGHEPLQLGTREQCPKLLVHVHFLISNLRKTVCGKVSIHQSWQPRNTLNSFSTGAPPGPRRGFTVDWDETSLSHPNSRCLWHLFLGAFHTLSLKFVPTS